jgi:hypothetical protein
MGKPTEIDEIIKNALPDSDPDPNGERIEAAEKGPSMVRLSKYSSAAGANSTLIILGVVFES